MESQRASGRSMRIAFASVVVIALLVLGAWLLSGGGSQETAAGPGQSPTPTASRDSASPGASESAAPSDDPTDEPSAESTPSRSATLTPSATRKPSPSKERTPTALVTVPVEPLETRSPVELTETADFGTGLTAEVVDLKAVTGVARVQGEIAGPALWVEIRVRNDSDEAISLASAQVEVTYGPDRTPGVALSGPDVAPFPASLAPGESATGAFVYGVPLDARDQVQIVVFYSTDAPLVVFEGSAP